MVLQTFVKSLWSEGGNFDIFSENVAGGRLFVTVMAVKEKLVSPHVCVTEAIRQLYARDLITKVSVNCYY